MVETNRNAFTTKSVSARQNSKRLMRSRKPCLRKTTQFRMLTGAPTRQMNGMRAPPNTRKTISRVCRPMALSGLLHGRYSNNRQPSSRSETLLLTTSSSRPSSGVKRELRSVVSTLLFESVVVDRPDVGFRYVSEL